MQHARFGEDSLARQALIEDRMAPRLLRTDFERCGCGGCEEGGFVKEGFGALGYEGEGFGGGVEGRWEAGGCLWLWLWGGHCDGRKQRLCLLLWGRSEVVLGLCSDGVAVALTQGGISGGVALLRIDSTPTTCTSTTPHAVTRDRVHNV